MRPLAAPVAVFAVPTAARAAADDAAEPSVVAVVLAVAAALIVAVLLTEAVAAALRAVGRRRWLWAHLARRTSMPLRVGLTALAVWVAVGIAARGTPRALDVACTFVGVAALTWLLAVVGPACVDAALGRHRVDGPGHRFARGSRAQASAARAVVRAVVLLGGLAGLLLVLPQSRVAGVVVLALLGLVLVALVAAAVPWLRDVVAGLELAAADALRVDDVVAIDGVWGRVEEVTATSVVVQAWDDRRVVVPVRRLTGAAFENWTRRTADLVGTVELDLPPDAPVAEVRAELGRAVEGNDLWDRRVAVLQVTDATGGRVRVQAVVSAADAPRLADLRCDVREALVGWLAVTYPAAAAGGAAQPAAPLQPAQPVQPARPAPTDQGTGAPSSRRARHGASSPSGADAGTAGPPGAAGPAGPGGRGAGEPSRTTVLVDPRRDSRLFTGSVFAVERSRAFTGPGADVLAERDAADDG